METNNIALTSSVSHSMQIDRSYKQKASDKITQIKKAVTDPLGQVKILHSGVVNIVKTDRQFSGTYYTRDSIVDSQKIDHHSAVFRGLQGGTALLGVSAAINQHASASKIGDKEGVYRAKEDLATNSVLLAAAPIRMVRDIEVSKGHELPKSMDILNRIALGGFGLALVKKGYDEYQRGSEISNFMDKLSQETNIKNLFNLTKKEITSITQDFYAENIILNQNQHMDSEAPLLTQEQNGALQNKIENAFATKMAVLKRRVGDQTIKKLEDEKFIEILEGSVIVNDPESAKNLLLKGSSNLKQIHYVKSLGMTFFGAGVTIIWAMGLIALGSNAPSVALTAAILGASYVLISSASVITFMYKAYQLYSKGEYRELALFIAVSALSFAFLVSGLNIAADILEGAYLAYLVLYKAEVLSKLKAKISEYFNDAIQSIDESPREYV